MSFTPIGPEIYQIAQGATLASGVATVIVGPINLMRYPSKTVTLFNQGAFTLSGALVQVNPDPCGAPTDAPVTYNGDTPAAPNPAMWTTIDSTSLQSVGTATARASVMTGAYRWWRIIGTNREATSLAVSGYVYAATI